MQQRQLAALLETEYNYTRPQRGDVYEAVVLSIFFQLAIKGVSVMEFIELYQLQLQILAYVGLAMLKTGLAYPGPVWLAAGAWEGG